MKPCIFVIIILVAASVRALHAETQNDSERIQAELDKMAETGGIVTLRPQKYYLRTPLRIPEFVTLQGSFRNPPSVWNKGTELLAEVPSGDEKGQALITLEGRNSTIEGLRILYPKQDVIKAIAYPWTIQSKSDDICVRNICLVNSFLGINLASGGRHLVQGVNGQPLKIGIRIDGHEDLSRLEDIHFWPFFKNLHPDAYQLHHGIALEIRCSEWQIVHNFFAYGYHTGVLLASGQPRGGMNGQFSNLNLDAVKTGIRMQDTNNYGVHISNLNIASNFGEYAIVGDPGGKGGRLSIQGASFWGSWPNGVIHWNSNGLLMLSSSIFEDWGRGKPAIRFVHGRGVIQGNFFNDRIGQAVVIEKDAERVTVTGNQLTGNGVTANNPKELHHVESNHR